MSISNAPKLVRNVKDFDILKLYYFLIMKSCVHDSYICTGSPTCKSLHLSHEDGHFPDIQYVFWCISETWIP